MWTDSSPHVPFSAACGDGGAPRSSVFGRSQQTRETRQTPTGPGCFDRSRRGSCDRVFLVVWPRGRDDETRSPEPTARQPLRDLDRVEGSALQQLVTDHEDRPRTAERSRSIRSKPAHEYLRPTFGIDRLKARCVFAPANLARNRVAHP